MRKLFVFFIFIFSIFPQSIDKRLRNLEKGQVVIQDQLKNIDKRFEQMDKRFEQINNNFNDQLNRMNSFIQILAGIFTAMVIGMAGLIYWDRKTFTEKSSKKVLEKINDEGDVNKILPALREFAKTNKKLNDILQKAHLL